MVGDDRGEMHDSNEPPNQGGKVQHMEQPWGSFRDETWQSFKKDILPTRKVRKILIINRSEANVFVDNQPTPYCRFLIGSVSSFEEKLEAAQRTLGIDPRDMIPVYYAEQSSLVEFFSNWLPVILLGTFLFGSRLRLRSGLSGGAWMRNPFGRNSPRHPGDKKRTSRSGTTSGSAGIFGVGKANPSVFNVEDREIKTTFKDVAGLDEAKQEIMEFVSYLKHPAKYEELGARIPKGALMHGPPGTGKTLLARATAGEAGVPFLTMSGSDFMEMFVGVGPSRVRDLFSQARELAPCIVFIDEIDAIGRARGRGGMIGGNDERENTLNQLLVELDGFTPNAGVVVFGGTNRIDILDNALLRPGRFDRQISIDPPDIKGRKDIFNVHLKNIRVAEPPGKEAIARRMASLTPGFAGADIANVCNEAALITARNGKEAVDMDDFDAAVDRVIGGLEKRNLVMTPEEKRTVAYHEAGHAVAGWFLEHAMPLLKVSIVPRGTAALGYAQYQPQERNLISELQLRDHMCMALAGRASEDLFFDSVTTGAADDFNRVTQLAYQSVVEWGLGRTIGKLAFAAADGETDRQFYKPYSDRLAQDIDIEVREIVRGAYDRTKQLLEDRKNDVIRVAELLLEQEVLSRDDMITLLGRRPGSSQGNTSYEEILEGSASTSPASDEESSPKKSQEPLEQP
uniref:AAA+ ATPase domain-containing protein n=1 Tax=Compsopogon caeruleus TaxID=31354 RepID=A0A7S1XE91_9RHOD